MSSSFKKIMKISAKGQYAVRLMSEVAKSKEPLSITTIAKNQDISPKYLEQIVSKLVKSGLLESTRGHLGGYRLAKSASKISLLEILETTGDNLEIAPCVGGDCVRKKTCNVSSVWNSLGQLINDFLGGVTLQDLIDKTQGAKN